MKLLFGSENVELRKTIELQTENMLHEHFEEIDTVKPHQTARNCVFLVVA